MKLKIRKSKIIISSILAVSGASLMVGTVSAKWAVTDNANPFSVKISVDVPTVERGYYLTFESDNYLTSGSKAIKMTAAGDNKAQTTSVSISNADKVRIYYYDGNTVEDASSLTTYSLPDTYGYASLGGDNSTLTFNTSRSGNSFSFYLNNENKLYLVDETYNSYDGYYISYSTNSGSTWCSFADAIHMSDTSGDNVAEYTGSFNSDYIYKIEHFSGTKGIISSAKLQGGTYTHFTNSAAGSASLSFKESTSYKLMLSAGNDKIYIQKPSASSLSGYYLTFGNSFDPLANTSVKMNAGTSGNLAELTTNISSGDKIKIFYYDGENDVNGNAGTLGAVRPYLTNGNIGDNTLTFNKTNEYTFYLNSSNEIHVVASEYTIYFNAGGSTYWDQAGALFYAWVWKTNEGGRWIQFTSSSTKSGYYESTIHSYENNIKICRVDPNGTKPTVGSTTYGSPSVWNDTGDLTVAGDGYAYTITSWSSGSWSGAAI